MNITCGISSCWSSFFVFNRPFIGVYSPFLDTSPACDARLQPVCLTQLRDAVEFRCGWPWSERCHMAKNIGAPEAWEPCHRRPRGSATMATRWRPIHEKSWEIICNRGIEPTIMTILLGYCWDMIFSHISSTSFWLGLTENCTELCTNFGDNQFSNPHRSVAASSCFVHKETDSSVTMQ